jgi:hypothetical protein
MRKLVILLNFIFTFSILAQTNLNLESYKTFLQQNQNLSYDQLNSQFDAGYFLSDVNSNWESALYSDSINVKYQLTESEKNLIAKNGFVVSERLSSPTFGAQLLDIYHRDLPAYISSDAILHAIHQSYDEILVGVEISIIIPKLTGLLQTLHSAIPALANLYSSDNEMQGYVYDLDAYLTVPLKFLDITTTSNYEDNNRFVNDMYGYALDGQYLETNFFSSVARKIDFSQFKPRGHYDDEYRPILAKYFRAMMWLGRMELYLIAPDSFEPPTPADVKRQTIICALFSELIKNTKTSDIVDEIDSIIKSFVGDQDNVTLENFDDVMKKASLSSAVELKDTTNFKLFQEQLAQQPYADQKILSQVLFVDPMETEKLKPASSFLLFGQRFIIDSYVTGSVVYDKIDYEGITVKRMLPSTLDILFTLGNDASLQLLKEEVDNYHYSTNLAALRYLIDQYLDDFWSSSIYNNWLNAIRDLNPPADRSGLPEFMQTAAWWQQKMNTQLASWAELRHDNLLYAKQSYTGGVTCSYPFGYVEPVPAFFESVKTLAQSAYDKLSLLNFSEPYQRTRVLEYFINLENIADTLQSIASKELAHQSLSEDETAFLCSMLSEKQGCGGVYDGWYTQLYYAGFGQMLNESDFLVADYHTSPTDESGSMVGWVKHAGTGYIDLMIFTAEIPGGENVAFVGPVYSYHEYTTTNFERLTDYEWKDEFLEKSNRPDWVNNYLADKSGDNYGTGPSLLTSINEPDDSRLIPETHLTARNYPNPFNPSTIISFSIPRELSNSTVKLTIHSISGEVVATLINNEMPAGNYLTKWDGKSADNKAVASGIYFYNLRVGAKSVTGKMNLIK